jgi:hypothetical protein
LVPGTFGPGTFVPGTFLPNVHRMNLRQRSCPGDEWPLCMSMQDRAGGIPVTGHWRMVIQARTSAPARFRVQGALSEHLAGMTPAPSATATNRGPHRPRNFRRRPVPQRRPPAPGR